MRPAIVVMAMGVTAVLVATDEPQVAEGRWQEAERFHLTVQAGTAVGRDTLPVALVGEWEGTVALDSGSVDDGAPIRLTVARDGTVTGTVGDATLANARLGRNPSLFARVLGLGTPWVLQATLVGPLDSASSLRRERATMPLELIDGELRGDFNAAGGGRLLSVRARLDRR